jgi:CspA family cold shock protein
MSRSPASPLATNVQATLKWFNQAKGFGFVSPADGSPDAFLHISVLSSFGYDNLPDGTTLYVDLVRGQKGPQVDMIHRVDTSTASATKPRQRERLSSYGDEADFNHGFGRGHSGQDRGREHNSGPTEEIIGTVKWFNPDKGFGFIAPDTGGKDLFLHISALTKSGLAMINEGERVRAVSRQGAKGPEAVSIEII